MNGERLDGRGRGRGRIMPVIEEGRGRGQRGRRVGARYRADDFELEVEPVPVRPIFAFEEEDAEDQQEEPEVPIDMKAAAMEDQAPVAEEQKMEEEEEQSIVQCVSREFPHGIVEVTEKTSGALEMMKQYFGKMRPFRVVQSFGPDEFYVIEEKDVASILRKDDGKLYQEFQAAMNKAEWDEIIGVTRAFRATPQECFAYQETHERQWYRVRLLNTFTFGNTAAIGLVYFLDLNTFQYVSLTDLRQLPDKFATGLARVFKCFLQDALPVNPNPDDEDEPTGWSKEAVEYFNELIMGPENEGKTVNVLTVKVVEEPSGKIANAGYSLGVVLFLGSMGERGTAMTSVGLKMIENGFADGGHHHHN